MKFRLFDGCNVGIGDDRSIAHWRDAHIEPALPRCGTEVFDTEKRLLPTHYRLKPFDNTAGACQRQFVELATGLHKIGAKLDVGRQIARQYSFFKRQMSPWLVAGNNDPVTVQYGDFGADRIENRQIEGLISVQIGFGAFALGDVAEHDVNDR